VVGTQPGQDRADRVSVADHHPVDAAHVARLRADLEPPRGADHGQRGLWSRASELERHGPAWLGQRAVGNEGAAPGRLAVAGAARHDLPRQAAHRSAAHVDQPGLPGQAVAVLDHPHHVAVGLAQSARCEHDQLGSVPEYLADVLAQPTRRGAGVKFGLDHDVAVVQVQSACEPQQRGDLSLPAARLEHADPAEFVLHQTGQGHYSHSPTNSASNTWANAPASRRGSCRSGRPAMTRSASTSRPPSLSAASSSSCAVSAAEPFTAAPRTAVRSASTTSNARSGAWLASTSRCAWGENPSVSPGWGARFSVTSLRAWVAISALASSGTSRCGSTLVNHDPGPSTTQSASVIASTAWAQAGGSAGTNDIDRTRPVVSAQAT